jgi:signal peptidase II
MKKWFLVIIVPLAIIIIDQWSKYMVDTRFYVGESVPVIKGFFNLTYVRNSGAAFGFGGEYSNWFRYTMFRALPVGACIWLAWMLIKTKSPLLLNIAYSLILGGAIGNLIDRFRLDYVVDMFDFYYGKNHFATFNVADSAITVAAGLVIIDFFVQRKNDKEQLAQESN